MPDTVTRPSSRAHVHAGRAQHDLGVVAGRQAARRRWCRCRPAARPAARTTSPARSRPAARTRSRAGRRPRPPSAAARPRGSRRSPPCAAAGGRRGRPAAGGCSRPRRASSVPRGCPASQPGRIRSRVPALRTSIDSAAGVRAAQARADQLQVRARAARLGPREPRAELGDGLERGGRVRRAQVAADLHAPVRHRADDRGAVRDRLVRRRRELARQRGRPGRSASRSARRCRPGRRRSPRPATQLHRALGAALAGDPERDRAGSHVRCRVKSHVDDVDTRLAERQRQLGHDPRPVGHRDAQLAHGAAGQLGLEQALAVGARALDPALQAAPVARAQVVAHRWRAAR